MDIRFILLTAGVWLGLGPFASPGRAAAAGDNVFAQTEQRFQGQTTCDASQAVTGDVRERASALFENGCLEAARDLVPDLEADSRDASRLLGFRILLAVHDYEKARTLAAGIDPATRSGPLRAILYLWDFETDDLESVRTRVDEGLAADPVSFEDLSAGAGLALALLDADKAEDYLTRAAEVTAGDTANLARWERLRSGLDYRRRNWDAALAHALAALAAEPLDADNLVAVGEALIRVGRTDEAVTAFTWAVRVNPLHERAHYQLGNGYARLNYTQLGEAYPRAFVDVSTRFLLENADSAYRQGYVDLARGGYEGLRHSAPGLADVTVRLGSLAFVDRDLDRARGYFVEALGICPEYGRAHNGLAKVLEAERLRIDVHRAAYETEFNHTPMPKFPIEMNHFVTNWGSLSPRHQKRVALSLAPWKNYLPVLAASGATFYIKPLHEKLSQSPSQETLKDQRIGYDSRLWDDVRGCGGYHTVTSIEDVERTIYGGYDTVLHELTHQVHGILTANRNRAIQDLYAQAKGRDAVNGDAFLSRYAGGSVYEYFAEGANALEHPRRDAYDTREMLRDRIEARDPGLVKLIGELMEISDVDSCYAVGFANQGDDRLREGDAKAAKGSYDRALERSPGDERVLESLIYAHLAAGETDQAVDRAGDTAMLHPESGRLAVMRAEAFWFAGYGLDAAIAMLEDALNTVRADDRHEVWGYLGNLYWIRGNAEKARQAYAEVLEYQADDPEALWGTGAAAALAGDRDGARAGYEAAIRNRTGLPELRAAFAWDLLREGDAGAAREQVDAGLLLEPDSPDLMALDAWLLLDAGDTTRARDRATEALAAGEWSDLARVIKSRAELASGQSVTASETLAPLLERIRGEKPPEFVFLPERGEYKMVHELPAVLREMAASAQ